QRMGRPIRRIGPIGIVFAALCQVAAHAAGAADVRENHGLSAFGDLKYPAGFTHFDYVNTKAPKGGTLRLRGIDTFDNLNPYILKGVNPVAIELIHATLMERATDEPDALYGFVARSVAMPDDRSWIVF